MDFQEIKQLIKVVEKSEIGEIEIVEEGRKIRITKNNRYLQSAPAPNGGNYAPYQVSLPAPPPGVTAQQPAATETEKKPEPELAANVVEVRSPMVGTFYRAPAPDADPYVEIGDTVKPGQTLCIIEAMKLMNEIQSEFSGRITKIVVENAQPVEFDQVLFLIEKA